MSANVMKLQEAVIALLCFGGLVAVYAVIIALNCMGGL